MVNTFVDRRPRARQRAPRDDRSAVRPQGRRSPNRPPFPRLVLAVLFGVVAIFPLLYMLSLSFQPVGDILSSGPVLIPRHPTIVNYVQAWSDNSFGHYFANSALVSLGTVLGTLVIASITAYGFARFDFVGKEPIFYLLLASLAVPSVVLILPQYTLMKSLGLINSRVGLTLLYISGNIPFAIFLLRGFMERIPAELEEAMRLDGVSTLGVLVRLIVPLSTSALATVAIFTFNAAWDEFVLALTMINSPGKRTVPIALALFQQSHTTAWGPLFAASVIATVPSIAIFVIAQRWFRDGVSVGALR